MALLEVTQPDRHCHIMKSLSPVIHKHLVGDQYGDVRLTGAEIKIGKSIVVDVPEVRAHRQHRHVQPLLFRQVGEGPVPVAPVMA